MCVFTVVTVLAAAALPSAYTMNLRTMETLDTMGLISVHGWRANEYVLQTADGYLLRLHRIVPSDAEVREKRVPVLVQHGLLCASDTWVLRGRKDLVFMLMEAGYDVWLGNVRGNNYCKSHVRLNSTADPFWDYSFHEMGIYDVPAMIDFILAKNGAKQLFYIGHSMGTTMFYVMASARPEYNSKVRAMISLAPVAFQGQYPPMLKQLARHRWQIWDMLNKQGIHQVWPRMPWLSAAEANFCRDGSPYQRICVELMFAVTGRDYTQFNKTMIPMIIHHLSSTNPRTLVHFGQNVVSGRFQWFDYGPKLNRKVYGRKEAPDYDLSSITTPVSLHYSTNDFLSYEKDVMKLANLLPNLVGMFKVPYKNFNHIDYLWGNDADSLLYKDILHLMNKL